MVTSILGSRKPRRPLSVPSRVLRHERVGSVRLTSWGGMAHGGIGGAPRRVCGTLGAGGAPVLSRLVRPEGGRRAHGCRWVYTPWCTTLVRAQSCLSAGIDKGPGGGPHPHHDAHRGTTGRTAGHAQGRGCARWWRVLAGVSLHNQLADGRERDDTTGMEKAEMADFLQAIGHDLLKEPTEKLHAVEVGGAEAGTAHLPVGKSDRAVREVTRRRLEMATLKTYGAR